jgi:hypothetical protein
MLPPFLAKIIIRPISGSNGSLIVAVEEFSHETKQSLVVNVVLVVTLFAFTIP